jgi:hypothetical protein
MSWRQISVRLRRLKRGDRRKDGERDVGRDGRIDVGKSM